MPKWEAVKYRVAATPLLGPLALRVNNRLRGASTPPRPTGEGGLVRHDPVPPMQPFPAARYVFAVGAIPRRYGGRTASILSKTKAFADAGVESEILTMNYSGELRDVETEIRERGALAEGVKVTNLHEILGGPAADGPFVEHPVDVAGLTWEAEASERVYRYYENGVYVMFRRYDREGRLLIEDHFNANRGRTIRHDFAQDGRIRRTTYYDLHYNRPRQEVYLRSDGTPYMNRWLVVNPGDLSTAVERVTLFDPQGQITRVLHSYDEVVQEYLDRVVADDRVFLHVESRLTDKETLPWRRPNVKQVYVLHNPHLLAPYNVVDRIRPSYAPLLAARKTVAATVFLTERQRADAEAVYGRTTSWKVIPHAAEVATDLGIVRDPNLVVMMARLDQQKQLNHAIEAFVHVVRAVPKARLEIWGRGTDEKELAALIARKDLGGSVFLKGYTSNPNRVYQQAAMALVTSKYEGFGLVILESLTNGCPVVSYDLKYGPSDILTDGVNGYLVRANSIKGLAQRTVSILESPELQRRLAAGTIGAADRFSKEAFLARWSALYNELDAEGWGQGGA